MKKIVIFLLVIFIGQQVVVGQCDPPAALTCSATPLLCALDMLDGYSCTTLSTNNPTGPNPLCSGSGTPSNTQWWAFKGNGKVMTITFNVDMSSCSINKGIAAGILGECGFGAVTCNANCNNSNFSLSFSSYRCQTYTLWVDGCEGDICDFDIQITNGEPKHLPNPLVLTRYPHRRKPCTHSTYCVEIEGICDIEHFQWSLDGMDLPSRGDQFCYTYSNPKPGIPKEVCIELIVGKGGEICDQDKICVDFIFEPSHYINEGDIYVCFEEHQETTFKWKDSIIYASCISPPCKKTIKEEDGCYTEYTAAIFFLENRGIGVSSIFLCGNSNIPYDTEDGQRFIEEACGEEISWNNEDYYNCDTTYILYLDIYDPIVSLSNSCLSCNDSSIILKAKITEELDCVHSQILRTGFWLDESLDTIGYGDSIWVNNEGDFSFHMLVQNTNSITGVSENCILHDTSWHITIKREPLTILGDTSICQVDTSEYSLPASYSHGCKIEWTLEDLNGQIITPAPDKMSTVKVHWPTHNTVDGKICAEYIDDCDSVIKVCFDLEGCVTTNSQKTSQNQWSVFPNPARGIIYIQGGNLDKTTISMHDLEGKVIDVQPKQDISGAVSIDIEKLTSGIYLIQLSDGEKKEVLRFVKL